MHENYLGQYLKTHLQPVLGTVSVWKSPALFSFQAELTFFKNTSIFKQNIKSLFSLPFSSL